MFSSKSMKMLMISIAGGEKESKNESIQDKDVLVEAVKDKENLESENIEIGIPSKETAEVEKSSKKIIENPVEDEIVEMGWKRKKSR